LVSQPAGSWQPALAYTRDHDVVRLECGKNRQKIAADTKPNVPTATIPAPSEISAVMADKKNGPELVPVSEIKRHRPKNWVRPSSGAASAPSVITMPEPKPLPSPISMHTSTNGTRVVQRGIAANDSPNSNVQGRATQRRPYSSITFPAG